MLISITNLIIIILIAFMSGMLTSFFMIVNAMVRTNKKH